MAPNDVTCQGMMTSSLKWPELNIQPSTRKVEWHDTTSRLKLPDLNRNLKGMGWDGVTYHGKS